MVLCKMCNLPNISTIRDMVEIFALIVGGVAAIRGMSFLSELKKKRSAAVFTKHKDRFRSPLPFPQGYRQ